MPRLSACLLASILFTFPLAATNTGSPQTVKFLVMSSVRHRPVTSDQLAAAGAQILAKYDAGAHAISLPVAARDAFLARVAVHGAEVRELPDTIHTPGRVINPHSDAAAPAPAAGLYVVQYVAPATPDWQAALQKTGAIVVQAIPERAAIVAADRSQADALRSHAFIQYVAPYVRDHKFKPAPVPASEFVLMVADAPLSAHSIADIQQRVGPLVATTSFDGVLTARFQADLATANELLNEPFVIGVETYVAPRPSYERQALALTGATTLAGARTIAGTGGTPADYRDWLNKYGFTPQALVNSSVIVDIADGGVDMGCSSPFLATLEHPDLKGRIVYHNGAQPPGTTEPAGSSRSVPYKDQTAHGTIVAGIVAGNPSAGYDSAGQTTTGRNLKDSDAYGSFYYGMGIAPGLRLGSTVMMNPSQIYGNDVESGVKDWTTRAVTRYCNTPTSQCTSKRRPLPGDRSKSQQ